MEPETVEGSGGLLSGLTQRPVRLKRTSIALMVVLTVVTFGLYQPFWFLIRREGFNELDSPRKIQRWPFIVILVFVAVQVCVSLVFGPRKGSQPTSAQTIVELTFRILQIPVGLLLVVQSFFVKDIIEDHLAGTPDDPMMTRITYESIKLSWVWTLLLNVFYLQHVINRRVVGTESRTSNIVVEVPLPSSSRYAGFWIRFAASLIDGLIIITYSTVAGIIIGGVVALRFGTFEIGFAYGYLTAIACVWLYYALSESSVHRATIGKRAVGIVVSDAEGRRLTFSHATGRAFAKLFNLMTLGIGWLLVGLTTDKKGLHDYLAGTAVTLRPDTLPLSRPVIALICAGAFIPIAGITAAGAIPGLLRARTAGNEASAIRTLGALRDAQRIYRQVCGGFAPNVVELIKLSGGEFGHVVGPTTSDRGYTFTIRAAGRATQNAPNRCDGPVADYVAQASPVESGKTGSRYFVTDGRGIIFVSPDQEYSHVTPLQ